LSLPHSKNVAYKFRLFPLIFEMQMQDANFFEYQDSAYGSFEPYDDQWKYDLQYIPVDYPLESCSPTDVFFPSFSPVDVYIPTDEYDLEHISNHSENTDLETPPSTPTKDNMNVSTQRRFSFDGKKSFACSMCSSSFSRNHDLKRHMRIHLNIRPYRCEYCPKAFTRMDALHRHSTVNGCKSMK
jgi:hypothetical protein